MKKLIYLTSLVGMGLFVNSCSMGYVATEPIYVENTRPARPDNFHIWIDGDWVYSHQSHSYARNTGYWAKPNPTSTYVSGQWQNSSKGKYWQNGHWEKNKQNEDHRSK